MRGLLTVAWLAVSASAWAVLIKWVIQDLAFNDDTDTNTYSDISIITSAGQTLSGFAYNSLSSGGPFAPRAQAFQREIRY